MRQALVGAVVMLSLAEVVAVDTAKMWSSGFSVKTAATSLLLTARPLHLSAKGNYHVAAGGGGIGNLKPWLGQAASNSTLLRGSCFRGKGAAPNQIDAP